MGDLITIPFKIENRKDGQRGYPCLNWFYNGLRYESLIDTGADNNVFPLQFLKLLHQEKAVDIDKIYNENKFSPSSGVGGSIFLTHPIPIKIEVRQNNRNVFINIIASFCIPDNKAMYDAYVTNQEKLSKMSTDFNTTKDTRLKQRLAEEYPKIQKNIQKYNPPFLFGKPFIAKLDYVKFVIDNERADKASYFEFTIKDSSIVS